MSQKLFQVWIPNLAQIVLSYYQIYYKYYYGFVYYDVVTMTTNVAQDNPYPHIRFTIVFCLTVKGWSKHLTFKSHAIISSTHFWTNHQIFTQLECNSAIKNGSLSWNTPWLEQSMIYSYRGAYIAAVYLAGPQNPYKISSPLFPLHTWYLLPLKLSNKLNLPLLGLKEYIIFTIFPGK